MFGVRLLFPVFLWAYSSLCRSGLRLLITLNPVARFFRPECELSGRCLLITYGSASRALTRAYDKSDLSVLITFSIDLPVESCEATLRSKT